ncbi:hypothetical protein Ancab_003483, partial [Ancistrocladus abbreviatus]
MENSAMERREEIDGEEASATSLCSSLLSNIALSATHRPLACLLFSPLVVRLGPVSSLSPNVSVPSVLTTSIPDP